uniref:Protein FAR1-RELATED SEQUENCE n=1 Tax=Anthurium amnicola TaxID=1678845 RepID=A0A1D1ZER9_9ARAE
MANVYTRYMFKKFQVEVLGMSSVFLSKSEQLGDTLACTVKGFEVQDHNKKIKVKEYKVEWNASERKISCICCNFEFKGYLCRHALTVLLASSVLEIPSHYILKRWTKDAKDRCTLNGSYTIKDTSKSITQRFNDICARSIKFAEEASLSKESFETALIVLEEVLKRVVNINKNIEKVGQQFEVSTITPVERDPKICNTVGAPRRIKSGVEISSTKVRKRKCSNCKQQGHNVTSCKQVWEQYNIFNSENFIFFNI